MLCTFISLVNVEAGTNVEGGQNLQINKCGGWNKVEGGKIINVEGGQNMWRVEILQ